MAVKVYKVREKEVNGKVVKEYYNEELDVSLNIKVDENNPYIVYDDAKKQQLKGEELKGYMESHEEEFESLEDEELENDDIPGLAKIDIMPQEVNDKYSFLFNESSIVHHGDVGKGLKLDVSKEFTKQQVSGKSFQNAVKYIFDENNYGHVKDNSIFAIGLSNGLAAIFRKMDYDVQVIYSSDTRTHQEYLSSKGYTEQELEEKRQKYDEELREQAEELKIKAEEEGKDFDVDKFINETHRMLQNKPMLLEYKPKYDLGSFVDKYKLKDKVYDGEAREIPDIEEAIEDIKLTQLGLMSEMLGNGEPRNAYEQFLDKNALKEGRYEYDEKAIDSFMKKNFLKDKDLEKLAVQEMDIKDFQKQYENSKGWEPEQKSMSFELAAINGRKILEKDGMPHGDKECARYYQNKQVAEIGIKNNQDVIRKASIYTNLMNFREKRSRAYAFFHPFKNRDEKKLLKQLKSDITAKLVEGTEFTKNIEKILDPKTSYKDRNLNMKQSIKNVNEPYKSNVYFKANKDMFKVDKLNYGEKDETTYFKNKNALLKVIDEAQVIQRMYESGVSEECHKLFKNGDDLGFDPRDIPHLAWRTHGKMFKNVEELKQVTLGIVNKALHNRKEFLDEYYDFFEKTNPHEKPATTYEETRDKYLAYAVSQLNSWILDKNPEYRKERYEKDVMAEMKWDEKTAIDSQLSFELCDEIVEMTGINPNGFIEENGEPEISTETYTRKLSRELSGAISYFNGKEDHVKINVPDFFVFQEDLNYADKNNNVPVDYLNKFLYQEGVNVKDSANVILNVNTILNNSNGNSMHLINKLEQYDNQTFFIDGKSLKDLAQERLNEIQNDPNIKESHTVSGVAEEILSKAFNEGKAIDYIQMYEEKGNIHTRIIPVEFVPSEESLTKKFGSPSKNPYNKTKEANEATKEERHSKIMDKVNNELIPQINAKVGKSYKPGINLPQKKEDIEVALNKFDPSRVRQSAENKKDLMQKLNVSVEAKANKQDKVKENTKEISKEIDAPSMENNK